ncbi:MAG: hypothetical protein EAZ97_06640 [Bacteroidetes bacterium]|nr:MAG: hypothetical protein EAZ97_06640 [Bacteroidota bacterium]
MRLSKNKGGVSTKCRFRLVRHQTRERIYLCNKILRLSKNKGGFSTTGGFRLVRHQTRESNQTPQNYAYNIFENNQLNGIENVRYAIPRLVETSNENRLYELNCFSFISLQQNFAFKQK